MKETTNTYGWTTISILVIAIIMLLAMPFAGEIRKSITSNVHGIQSKADVILDNIKEEDFFGKNKNYTYYTSDNIVALGDRAATIGYNDPLYVIGLYSEDFSEVIVSRNGNQSDGVMIANSFLNNESLESAIIKVGVLNVSNGAFEGCSHLNSVFLPDGLLYIGYNAFAGTALTSITIPDTVTTIEYGAFYNCNNLETIIFEGDKRPAGFYESDYPGVTIIYNK